MNMICILCIWYVLCQGRINGILNIFMICHIRMYMICHGRQIYILNIFRSPTEAPPPPSAAASPKALALAWSVSSLMDEFVKKVEWGRAMWLCIAPKYIWKSCLSRDLRWPGLAASCPPQSPKCSPLVTPPTLKTQEFSSPKNLKTM